MSGMKQKQNNNSNKTSHRVKMAVDRGFVLPTAPKETHRGLTIINAQPVAQIYYYLALTF